MSHRSPGSPTGRPPLRLPWRLPAAATAAILAVLGVLAVLLPQQATAAPAAPTAASTTAATDASASAATKAGTGTGTGATTGTSTGTSPQTNTSTDAGTSTGAAPVCGAPQPGHFSCFALRRTAPSAAAGERRTLGGAPAPAASPATPEGYAPADLRSAYALPDDGGAGATIAIVDAYDDPDAESDLAVYRAQYGLPACTTDNGCFRKTDQRGGAGYPGADEGWASEISLDLDMVSAVAPQAHILLVEADSSLSEDLGAAENTAVALGARYVSNSWGGYGDSTDDLAYDQAYFDHPGTAVVFSSGDDGYGVSYPASSPYVTAVGGTSLTRDGSARGWDESVWNGITQGPDGPHWGATGSGCSAAEPKPAFQSAVDCAGRSVADVSAVADPATGVAVYNSYSDAGWNVYGGTSASAPIIAGVYALAGAPVAGTYPASYPYQQPGALNDVTRGDDASCADASLCGYGTTPDCTPAYTCQAQPGYDGPTGLGTPNGVAGFKPGPHGALSGAVTDAATKAPVPGATVALGDYRATTDAQGRYRLDVPAGSYPLTVSAFGYADDDAGTVTIADGAALTRDAALTAVATQTVSGTVRDGGGHGWGLYAKITLDGVPGAVFTDPATGRYTVKVPAGHSYTLHAAALYAGYATASATVDVGSGPRTADLSLPLAGTGVLPPGYVMTYHGGGLETFADAATPAGWTVKNNTAAGGWQFDDPLNRGNQTGGSGRFAEVDDFALGWAAADTELISPAYDFSAEQQPELQFDTALPPLYRLGDLTAAVDASTDGGATWTTLWQHTDVVGGPAHETVPLTRYAGRSSVRLRFHFTGSLTGIWQIDNVAVGTPRLVTERGGMLVGQVTDANTGAGVLGATVAPVAAPADSGRAVATPDDPATGDGLYWLFTGSTGKQHVTAGLPDFGYPQTTQQADVRQGAVTRADFALHPAQLRYSVSSVAANVPWGDSRTVQVKVKNTGGSPATFSLGEQDLGGPAASGAEPTVHRVPSAITPRTLQDAGAAPTGPAPSTTSGAGGAHASASADGGTWQPLADLPAPVYGGLAATGPDGTVYTGFGEEPGGVWSKSFSSYDPATGGWHALTGPTTTRFAPAYGVIRGKLYVTAGRDAAGMPIAGGEVYDPATDRWSQIADLPTPYGGSGFAAAGDKLYVIGGCDLFNCGFNTVEVYDPATDTWSAGAPYPEPIGFPVCGTVDDEVVCTGGVYQPNGAAEKDTTHTYVLDPHTGSWRRVADAPTDVWGATGTAADGQLLVAGGFQVSADGVTDAAHAYDPGTDTWRALPSLPQPVMEAASAPGWYALGGITATGGPQATALKLPGYDHAHGDVPWLTASAKKVTVKAGGTVTVRLTLDAEALTSADAGSHRAALIVDSDTPYGSPSLPVTMTVVPPAGWGLLTGTVTGRPADGGAPAPLAGAVVEVDTKNGDVTLTTGADGRYSLWLPAKDNPVTVIVAATGYRPATATVRIVKEGSVSADFALRHL
ncbi:carboxypeptidase regulatory-like domain-containing protein [Actinacidiphila sp. DG2A-62]|uniref:carboxypeptidase regulatory-like domain-containing protein n=1 Tax=Actinacidiphila sp. DG2A-62 TaxID=3108821 RepID=UPI002DB7E3E9|nr:carboxypeptidase regulatory-like domain-containing protein [Actinacidiphila sp. DG2A-62]MEC3998232.1 carboxypeptidase regulatory-like domain-containing protein [Actinacidiphila sp. DG2A-62]